MGKLLVILLRIFMLIQLYHIALKLDGILEFGYAEVMWPFWIVFAVLMAISLALLLVLITKVLIIPFEGTEEHKWGDGSFVWSD